ncbi:response regulator transcription factor [Desulfuribacillus alkaliarsenatis]|uniref:DNA-binding response regulator n=1 Tax=Desulfuribacillus alkaliarsenatis TaxID=766136 RepID=A0A1E5G4M7_9FIRM|nr:response regulator transcription factor [Desulfuribacillus alkaliarsenatis]OEF98142.1 DNA-binding response regulator [Desulfuribacillus alkaliarsenatis]
MAGETILIVDDDCDIREIISMYLQKEGYIVQVATNGYEAIEMTANCNPSLIILDMMLPGLDGIEVCQEIRKTLSTPILFLSCKGTPLDKSMGLTAGGDDYMSKPFDAVELLARVKAQLRRNRILSNVSGAPKKLEFEDLIVDLNSHSVIARDKLIDLSPKEFQLLALLAQTPNVIFSSEQIFQSLWGADSMGDHRTVMVHISNIRKKIELDPSNSKYIHTVKGVGYKFIYSQID